MSSAIAEAVSALRNSSTTNTPAMSPLKLLDDHGLAMYVLVNAMSGIAPEAVPDLAALFTMNQYSFVDARYLPTTVSHVFCTTALLLTCPIPVYPAVALKLKEYPDKQRKAYSEFADIVRHKICSPPPAGPVKRTTATIVRPPFVEIFKVRGPASRYWDWDRSKETWPLP